MNWFKANKLDKEEEEKKPETIRWMPHWPPKVMIAVLTQKEKEQIAEAFALAITFFGGVPESDFVGDAHFLSRSIPIQLSFRCGTAITKITEVLAYLSGCEDYITETPRSLFEFLTWAKYKILKGMEEQEIVFTAKEVLGFENIMVNVVAR